MSYQSDKAIFLRHYKHRAPKATKVENSLAWRAYFVAACVEAGSRVADAEAEYEKLEQPKARAFTPNPERRQLPGGHPHEVAIDVAVYSKPSGGVFAGALLEGKNEVRFIELTGTDEKFFRLSYGSKLAKEVLALTGQRRSMPPGFTELDAIVRRFSDDPAAFGELAAKDPDVDWLDAYPRAAALARWGPKGERAAKYL